LTVPGNVSPFAEANFWKDSEANNIVFDSGLPIKVIGLDVTLRTLITDTDIAPWLEMSEAAEVFHEIVTYYFKAYANSYEDLTGCALHDPLAVSVALNSDWVTGETFRIKSLYGEQEGRLVQDQAALNRNEEPNVFVALGVDAEGYNKHFLDTIVKAF
ncbi:MAG: nucleoside hydrolase, partial [Aerococcus urinaeequi]